MSKDRPEREPTGRGSLQRRRLKPEISYQTRVVEERILAAQKAGAFDDLPGRGKPLALEDLSQVPQDLRVGYKILKNGNLLPPELELKKQILSLQDLLAVTGEQPERYAIVKELREKLIHADILRRRSFNERCQGFYGKKLLDKLRFR